MLCISLTLIGCADKDEPDKNTQLIQAAKDGDLQAVRAALAEGAGVNGKDNNGTTALMMASGCGHTEIVRLLLEKGSAVNVKRTDDGVTALFLASQNGHAKVAKLLLENDADVNVNADGETALFQASCGGHTEIVRLLLEKGATVNVKRPHDGITALWMASAYGRTEVVKLLLNAKADVDAKAYDGKTSLDIAKEKRLTQIIELLEEAGATKTIATGCSRRPRNEYADDIIAKLDKLYAELRQYKANPRKTIKVDGEASYMNGQGEMVVSKVPGSRSFAVVVGSSTSELSSSLELINLAALEDIQKFRRI